VARYIRYDDIFALVRDGIPFTIKDTARGKDQTHKVFTDLLIRAELSAGGQAGEHVFTEDFLRELIRLGTRESAPLVTAFLNHSIKTLLQAQGNAEPESPVR
jgi:polyhydroxyalkanoate synthesis regulator protein